MQKITVSKDQLLAKLKDSRAEHKADFVVTYEAFRQEALAQYRRLIAWVEAGEAPILRIDLVPPQNHEDDYETIITALEWEQNATVELEPHEVKQYLLDDWNWKAAFQQTKTFYERAK